MRVRVSETGVEVSAPAKLNLFLEVLARREDGFHEIETLMWPVGLFDTLSLAEQAGEGIELTVTTADRSAREPSIPTGPENLVTQALEHLRGRAGVRRGARVRLFKQIPSQAGLGGGSSDAAAALMAGNVLWRLGLSRAELCEMAAALGSDVPFFLAGGPALCRGRGERMEPVPRCGPLSFVIVHPPVGLSTAEVYSRCQPAETPRRSAPLLRSLEQGDWRGFAAGVYNALTPATASLTPWIGRLRDVFESAHVVAHGMSGSGSACFALCRSHPQACRLKRRLSAQRIGQVFVARGL